VVNQEHVPVILNLSSA